MTVADPREGCWRCAPPEDHVFFHFFCVYIVVHLLVEIAHPPQSLLKTTLPGSTWHAILSFPVPVLLIFLTW